MQENKIYESKLKKRFEENKKEFKEYIKTNPVPTYSNDVEMKNLKSMFNFYKKYEEKLLEDTEIKTIITKKELEEKEKFNKEELKIKKLEQKMLEQTDQLPKEFQNLTDIEKRRFYRECFLTKEEDPKTINNINVTKKQLISLKKLYNKCYATYIEKNKKLLNEEINKKEFEEIKYINTFCSKAKWNQEKIEEIAKNFNITKEEIKEKAIKYGYIYLFTEITKKSGKQTNIPTLFQIGELKATTKEEITKIPESKKAINYKEYDKNNESSWKNIKNCEYLPADEIIKMIYNIQTKATIYIEEKEKIRNKNNENRINKNIKTKENKANEIGNQILELLKDNQETSSFCDLLKKNNIHHSTVQNAMRTLKKTNNALYSEINNTTTEKYKTPITPTEEIIKILTEIKSALKQEKEFTILDYKKITDLDIMQLKKDVQKLDISNEDKRILSTFVSPIAASRPIKIKQILSITLSMKDENENIITITPEEIKNIINYMQENEIPLVTRAYNQILKSYINKKIDLSKNIKQIKK